MASSGKKKTTMAKLMRESRLREKRIDKQARKDARKLGLLPVEDQPEELLGARTAESETPDAEQAAPEGDAVRELADV
jgi:hypothetical protein